MARRKKQDTLGDLIDVLALLPWWLSLAGAPLSYLVLKHFAGQPQPETAGLDGMGTTMVWSMVTTGCKLGMLVIPMVLLVSCGFSLLRASRRRKEMDAYSTVARGGSRSSLFAMSWRDFEKLVEESFRRRGYVVVESGVAGADGGIDIELRKGTELFLVQCKQWRATKVGVEIVRELFGLMAARGATGGFVVSAGSFTKDAVEFCRGRNIEAVDGALLVEQMGRAEGFTSLAPVDVPSVDAPARGAQKQPAAGVSRRDAPAKCPSCSSPMVARTAKSGTNAGRQFLGCSRYPKCKGIRDLV